MKHLMGAIIFLSSLSFIPSVSAVECSSYGGGAAPAPLSSATTIEQPAASTPNKFAKYSGFWIGCWGSNEGRLAVRSVSESGKVKVLYSWGEYGLTKAGTLETKGAIKNEVLKLRRFSNGARAEYQMGDNGVLIGRYKTKDGHITRGYFRRLEFYEQKELPILDKRWTPLAEAAPLGSSIEIEEPHPELNSKDAEFSGVWQGGWDNSLDSKLAVTSISKRGKVKAVYSWGDHPDGHFEGSSRIVKGRVRDGVLRIKINPRTRSETVVNLTFEMQSDDTLHAEFERGAEVSYAVFTKQR